MSSRSVILAGLSALLVAGGAVAQPWSGPAGVEVRATSRSGPVAGAVVRLSYRSEALATGPAPVATDGNGRATVTGLAGGTWQLEVSHPDFMTFVAVVELGAESKPEVTASFLEATDTSTTSIKVRIGKAHGPSSPPLPVADRAVPEEPAAETAPPPIPREPRPAAPPEPAAPAGEAPPTAPRVTPPPGATEPPAPATEATAPTPPSEVRTPPAGAQEPPSQKPPSPNEAPAPPSETAAVPGTAPAPPDEAPEPAPGSSAPSGETAAAPTEAPAPPSEAPAPGASALPSGTPESPSEARPAAPEPPATAPPSPPVAPAMPPAGTPAPVPSAPAPEAPTAPPAPQMPAAPAVAPTPVPVSFPTAEPVRAYSKRTCVECRPGEWAVAERVTSAGGGGACSREDLDRLDGIMGEIAETDALELRSYAGPLSGARELLGAETAGRLDAALAALPAGCHAAAVVLPRNARFSAFQYEASDGAPPAPCLPDQPCEGLAARWHGAPHLQRGANATVAFGLFDSDVGAAGYLTVYFHSANPGWEPGSSR